MSTMTANNTDIEVRDFASFLVELDAGRPNRELSEQLHELVNRVTDTGKKGTVTLTVEVAPAKENDDLVVVAHKVVAKHPEHDRKASYYFRDADGRLTRDDPRQPSMFDGTN